jgi:hypothetical protein
MGVNGRHFVVECRVDFPLDRPAELFKHPFRWVEFGTVGWQFD